MVIIDSQWELAVPHKELKPHALWQPRGDRKGREGVQEGGNICISMADSCWYMAKTNSIVKQLSSN